MDKNLRNLEVTVLSCEDLRVRRRSVKKNTYVVVRTALNWRSTTMDMVGGSYPSWHQKLDLDMALHERFVTLEVHCKNAWGDRVIGSAIMPVTDFIGGYLPEDYLNFLSYRLVDPSGRRNGVVNVSVRVRGSSSIGTKSDLKGEKIVAKEGEDPTMAEKPRDGGEESFGGVAVMGIPVNWYLSS